MANIALSPRGATHPRASVQYLPYIPPSRDITITYVSDVIPFTLFESINNKKKIAVKH